MTPVCFQNRPLIVHRGLVSVISTFLTAEPITHSSYDSLTAFQSRSKFQQSWHIVMFIVMAWNQTLGQYVKSGHDRCLPHPFQFFIQHLLAILRSTIWPTDSGNKGRETEIQGHRFELRVLRSVRMLVYLPAVQATCISPSAVMYISWPVCIALLYFVSSNFG